MGDWGRAPTNPTRDSGEKLLMYRYRYIVSTSLFWAVSFTNKQFWLRKFFFLMCGGPLKCGGPCSAEHVRTLVNPALIGPERLGLCMTIRLSGSFRVRDPDHSRKSTTSSLTKKPSIQKDLAGLSTVFRVILYTHKYRFTDAIVWFRWRRQYKW